MKRREFISMLVGSVALSPHDVLSQALRQRSLIGYLNSGSKAAAARTYSAFPVGMRELGYIEGRDYAIEQRDADGAVNRLPALAVELVRLKPDLIVAGSTPGTVAARQATRDIPIVGLLLTDP